LTEGRVEDYGASRKRILPFWMVATKHLTKIQKKG